MVMSAHFVGDNWEMHYHCLQTCEVVTLHAAHNLAEEIHYSLDEWDVTGK